MGWSDSTASKMFVRYAHLFDSGEEQLTEKVDETYRLAEESRSSRTDATVTALSASVTK